METIPRGIPDPFYRYKRHKVQVFPEKHCTNLVNLDVIAKELYRQPLDLVKWFTFATKGSGVKPLTEDQGVSIKGTVHKEAMDDLLEEFIVKCVVCETCGYPETFFVAQSTTILLECNACGYSGKCKAIGLFLQYLLKEYGAGGKTDAQSNAEKKQEKRQAKIERNKAKMEQEQQGQ